MWNSINKLIDPNFKSVPSSLKRDSKSKRRGKRPNNKKRKARDEKRSYGRGRQDRSTSFRDKPSRDGQNKSFGFKGKSNFRDKPSRDGQNKSFGFNGKSNFWDKPSRDGQNKSFGFEGKSSFRKKTDLKPAGFTNNPKYFGRKPSENTSSDSEKKSFSFKGKKKFKSRNRRPKNFTFKKHNKKRWKS